MNKSKFNFTEILFTKNILEMKNKNILVIIYKYIWKYKINKIQYNDKKSNIYNN